MSTYTHPHVIPKLNAFLSLAQKEDILKNIDNQTVVMSIDFSIDFMDRKIHETFLKISVMFTEEIQIWKYNMRVSKG